MISFEDPASIPTRQGVNAPKKSRTFARLIRSKGCVCQRRVREEDEVMVVFFGVASEEHGAP
jgi:hypothetical protein